MMMHDDINIEYKMLHFKLYNDAGRGIIQPYGNAEEQAPKNWS